MLILFVDDMRSPNIYKLAPKDTIVLAKNYKEAIKALETYDFDLVTLDHDLGEDKSGYDIACWIEKQAHSGKKVPIIKSHSANPVGRARINQVANALR